jgi:hypothetical protein
MRLRACGNDHRCAAETACRENQLDDHIGGAGADRCAWWEVGRTFRVTRAEWWSRLRSARICASRCPVGAAEHAGVGIAVGVSDGEWTQVEVVA